LVKVKPHHTDLLETCRRLAADMLAIYWQLAGNLLATQQICLQQVTIML
jgi:hypothetical protein